MKIHSRFKDYYDYVAYLHGGGDPKVVYDRERVVPATYENGVPAYENHVDVPDGLSFYIPRNDGILQRWSSSEKPYWEYKALVVAGRWYILWQKWVKVKNPGMIYPQPIIGQAWTVCPDGSAEFGKFHPRLVELSRLVKAPVFTISGSGYNHHRVEGRVPNLGELGFSKVMKPEQCYQEIAMFLGNTILVNPDETPESKPPLTNEEKAVAHGFDKKQSFRHRK